MHCSVRVLALVSAGLLVVGMILFWYLTPFVCFSNCPSNLPLVTFGVGAIQLGPGMVGALIAFIAYERYLLSHRYMWRMYVSSSIVLALVLGALVLLWRTLGGALLPPATPEFGAWFDLMEAYSLCIVLGLIVLSTHRLPSPPSTL